MVFLDDLKEMTLYKKPFVLPIDEENIRKGSAIFLASPNAEASKAMMNYPYMINKMNTFNGYYLEKNANYYINQEGNLIPIDRDDEYLHEVSEEELEEGFFNKGKQKNQNSSSDYSDFLHKNYATESEWKAKYRSDFIATYKACIRKAESIGKLIMGGQAVKDGLFSYPDLHDDWPSSEMIKYMDRYEGGPNDRKSGICLKSLVVVETDFSGYSPKSSVDAILDKIEKDLNDCIPTKYKDESQKMFFRIKRFNGGNFMLIANSIIMHESFSYDKETTSITESEEELEEARNDGIILNSYKCMECGTTSRNIEIKPNAKPDMKRIAKLHPSWDLSNGTLYYAVCPKCGNRNDIIISNEDCIGEEYAYYNNKKYKKVPKSAKLYHGSRTQNLRELTPKNDSISRVGNAAAVYASKDRRFAACYGTAWRDDIAKQGTWDKWNTVVMGISDKVVMDQPCSLYELENDGSFIEISDKEVVSLNTIKVKEEHKYSSYAEMLKKNGVKVISYDEYIKNVKSPNPEFHYLNEDGIDENEFEYSNSFSDVMKVVNSLPKKDLLRICNGRFKDSPYVIYREVLSISGSPVSFIDVYKLPNMEEDGCIVLATNPKWRGKGLASTLVERMKHIIGGKNLLWKTQMDNHASLAIANANGYSPVFNEAGKSIPLTNAERALLSDSDFGIPSQRRYPMTDASHVKSAIRFFNYVDEEHEAELARNIKRKAKEFKVPIRCGDGNRLSKYITEEYVQEFMSAASIGNDMTAVVNGTIRQHMAQGDMVYSFDHQKPYTKKTKAKKPITESYVFSKDDMYINYDKFESGKSNVLLVTGLSGSGKSTLASKIKGTEWIELDIYETANCFTDDQLKQAGQVFVDFFDANPDRDAERKKRDYTVTVEDIRKFCKYAISWCNRHKEKKWVIEGVQIYSVMDYDDVKSYPMIIKGTSMVKSIIGRFKRNGEGKINWKNELSNEFLNLIGWYKDEEKILRNFKKAIIEEDANESANDLDEGPDDVFFDDMIKDIEKTCSEEFEPFPTDVLNEKKGSH